MLLFKHTVEKKSFGFTESPRGLNTTWDKCINVTDNTVKGLSWDCRLINITDDNRV